MFAELVKCFSVKKRLHTGTRDRVAGSNSISCESESDYM
jgi:hypothetical protein